MRFNNPHYYKILEINETASKEEISAAFRCLAKEYHPDRIPSHLPRLKHEAQEKLKQINEAYRVLSDPEKRRLYDTYLAGLREEETEKVNKESNYDYQESDTEEEERTTAQETTKVIITCPNCHQKLRVPEGQVLRVRCSCCGVFFDYPFSESYKKKEFISIGSTEKEVLEVLGPPDRTTAVLSLFPSGYYKKWCYGSSYLNFKDGKVFEYCQSPLGKDLRIKIEETASKEEAHGTERSWDDQSKNQYSSSGRQEESGQSEPTTGEAPRVGIWLRVFAYTIDFSILTCGIEALLWYVYVSIYPNFIIFSGYFLIFPLYFVYFMLLQSRDRQTMGERFMGIKVLPLSKTPLTKKKAILRYLCCLIPFYALATIPSLLNSKHSIADAIIKTQVLQVRKVPRVRFLLPIGLLIFWGLMESKARQENINQTTHSQVPIPAEPPKYAKKPPLSKQETGMSLLDTIEKNLQSEKPLLSKQETGIGILSTQDIAAKYWNSVVSISTYDAHLKNVGQGSGFVVDQSGIIVTNNHVVQSNLDPLIIFPNKEYYYASVLRRDITHDIAILKIKADNLPTVPLGDFWKISVGEKIIVIGNPLGLQNTVTEGIVSAIRVLEDKTKILQISAPVSPGSSGSPVINSSGQCIGIATMIVTEGQNLNFAVPTEYVVSLLGASKLPDVPKDEIKWITSFEEGMRLAKEQGKPVLIDFFADWSLPCKEMEATTWRDERVLKESERFVAIKMDSSKDDSPGSRLKMEKFNSFYIPYVSFYDSKGNYLEGKSIEGYADANTMLKVMQTINETLSKEYGLESPLAQSKSISPPPTLDPNKFYATKRSKTFHRSHCIQLDIKQELISFGSIEEAASLGGVPCNVCFTIKDKIK